MRTVYSIPVEIISRAGHTVPFFISRMSEPENAKENMLLADINPRKLLEGTTPRLIDKWQTAPKLWDAVRFEVDHRDELGQFILTGSSVPPSTDEIVHSGTGRFAWIKMRPMSLFESGDSTGAVSLADLFNTPEQIKRLMKSYARIQGSQATTKVIKDDMAVNDTDMLTEDTIYSYLNALKKIFVAEEMPAWNPNLKSKTAVRTSDTRYFIDPSIGTAALGLGPNDLINDLNTLGLFFETMCVRDLRVFADSLGGNVYHYRDKNNLECDSVIHLRNGTYGLIEMKIPRSKLRGMDHPPSNQTWE